MFIIVEGPNNSGKDTLIRALGKMFFDRNQPFLSLYFQGFNTRNEREMQIRTYYETVNCVSSKNVICNRFHVGEFVYGQIFRGYNPVEDLIEFENYLMKKRKDVVLIIATASVETLKNRFLKEKQAKGSVDDIDFDLIEKERKLFLEYFEISKLRKVIYCSETLKDLSKFLTIFERKFIMENKQ